MRNRAVFQKRDGEEWAEITLAGRRPLVAKVSLADLALVNEHRWGWHPRGVFAHREGIFLAYALHPHARRIGFRNLNRLDCRRENLIPAYEKSTLCDLRRRRVLRTGKRSATGVEGVHYDPKKGGYIARIKARGVNISAFFDGRQYGGMEPAKQAAIAQRSRFLAMNFDELVAFKIGTEVVDEHESRFGEDVCERIADRCPDPVQAAIKGYEAGMMAARILGGGSQVKYLGSGAKKNGKELYQ